jgi:hypothetical protein
VARRRAGNEDFVRLLEEDLQKSQKAHRRAIEQDECRAKELSAKSVVGADAGSGSAANERTRLSPR